MNGQEMQTLVYRTQCSGQSTDVQIRKPKVVHGSKPGFNLFSSQLQVNCGMESCTQYNYYSIIIASVLTTENILAPLKARDCFCLLISLANDNDIHSFIINITGVVNCTACSHPGLTDHETCETGFEGLYTDLYLFHLLIINTAA